MARFKRKTCTLYKVTCILLATATWAQSVSASCRVRYGVGGRSSNVTLPLLFGGTYGRCREGCQPRNDPWSDMCNPANFTRTAACQPDQIRTVIKAVRASAAATAVLDLHPCQLNEVLRNRTLWIMGDSHMRHFYSSLRCFLLDFWDHERGECAPTSDMTHKLKTLYDAADTQLTNLEGNSPLTSMPKCIHLLDGGRVCWVHSVRGEEIAAPEPAAPGVMQVLQRMFAQPQDIFWVNFGRWHFHNCIGLDKASYVKALNQLGLLFQKTRSKFPNVFFKVPLQDHTACLGDWSTKRSSSGVCVPASQGNYSLSIGQTLSEEAEKAAKRFGMNVVNTYKRSLGLRDAHIISPNDGSADCNHWCSPGLHEWDIWNMFKHIQSIPLNSGPLPASRVVSDEQQCLAVTESKPPLSLGWNRNKGSSE